MQLKTRKNYNLYKIYGNKKIFDVKIMQFLLTKLVKIIKILKNFIKYDEPPFQG